MKCAKRTTDGKTRIERDVLGALSVPENAYWGISTQRAIRNFQISNRKFPEPFVLALAEVKKACTLANVELGTIGAKEGNAILKAVDDVLTGKLLGEFPLDVFQTGSGTQINMNMNEVLANRANEILGHPLGKKYPVHPNDHVNRSQSSNDVVPTAMHLSTIRLLNDELTPSLDRLRAALKQKIDEFREVVKVGRTHLQDAVPIRLSMEFQVYEKQTRISQKRLKETCNELCFIPLGGTAVGTGVDADPGFGRVAVQHLRAITGYHFRQNPVLAEGISSHNSVVRTSETLRLLSLSMLKMANDIRWMGSGPRAGLGELLLPPNEPGSSIMPGKINPTQAEALIQVCLQVIGNDTTIGLAEGFGSILDLNVAKPLMIVNVLDSVTLLSKSISSFNKKCLAGLRANRKQIDEDLKRNLMVVTRIAPLIGYDKAAEIAKKASQTGKTIKEVIQDMNLKIKGDLDELLDPRLMV